MQIYARRRRRSLFITAETGVDEDDEAEEEEVGRAFKVRGKVDRAWTHIRRFFQVSCFIWIRTGTITVTVGDRGETGGDGGDRGRQGETGGRQGIRETQRTSGM
uniref:Uncharacterized protein n=1 Tax=Knipowitschia caucasica TaxID=637954 RepID=A0AAV2JU14_KNICA